VKILVQIASELFALELLNWNAAAFWDLSALRQLNCGRAITMKYGTCSHSRVRRAFDVAKKGAVKY